MLDEKSCSAILEQKEQCKTQGPNVQALMKGGGIRSQSLEITGHWFIKID